MTPAARPDPQALDSQICFPLYAASRLVTRLYQPLLDPLGLTYPQYLVLMILWAEAPCSVSDIGARAQLASNTLTPLLKRMAQAGLITRTRDAADERVVTIDLTTKGRGLKEACACVPTALLKQVGWPIEDVRLLKSMLDHLLRDLQHLV